MGLAESSESLIFAGKTLTEGTAPTTYETLTPTGHSLTPTAGSFQSEDIDPSGKALDSFRSSLAGGGDISFHWRPGIYDKLIESAMFGTFGSVYSQTLTISFSVPGIASGIQTLTDDGASGVLGNLAIGDCVLVGGAVANALNAGLRIVFSKTTNSISVWNPTGVSSPADAGVSITHQGVSTLGITKSWQWVERLMSDGVNLIYSEFYRDCVVERWSNQYPAAGPTRCAFGLRGDPPTLVHADGLPPIVKQRGGTDNPASTDRLVHGMDDVRQVVISNPITAESVVLHDQHNLLEFTVARPVRQDQAVGASAIINTSAGRPTVSGRIDAYLNSVADGTSLLVQYLLDNPDGLVLGILAGATDATAYGFGLLNVRMQGAATPVGGNNQATLINATFSATDLRVTRF